MKRTVFFVSESTGITAETLGHSLLSQFDSVDFEQVYMPYNCRFHDGDCYQETAAWGCQNLVEEAGDLQDTEPQIVEVQDHQHRVGRFKS